MKTPLILLAILSSLTISAQNWSPINLNSEYNYKIDTAQLITNTIFVDSISVNNNDSIFYLNRIMTNCDSCSNTNYKLKNQPQFLMKQVLKKSDSLFVFKDTIEFKIKPLKTLGDSWVFDSTKNITAIIDSIYTQLVFNVTDSIKRIYLSNNHFIILSKSFGILQFPFTNNYHYKLIGIRSNTLTFGVQLPRFWDFFNYEINDILQWKDINSNGGGIGSSYTFSHFKGTIISKTTFGDTVNYHLQGKKFISKFNYSQGTINTYNTFDLILTFIDSISHLSNCYPNQVSKRSHGLYSSLFAPTIFYMENGLQKKSIDFYNNPYIIVNSANNPDVIGSISNYGLPMSKFTVGLGEYIECIPFTASYTSHCMEGRIHLGDTIGTIYPDSFFVTGIEETTNDCKIEIYPNPSSGQFSIISKKLTINNINIIDITGKLIKTIDENTSVISMVDLPKGIYLIKITTNEGLITKKIINQ